MDAADGDPSAWGCSSGFDVRQRRSDGALLTAVTLLVGFSPGAVALAQPITTRLPPPVADRPSQTAAVAVGALDAEPCCAKAAPDTAALLSGGTGPAVGSVALSRISAPSGSGSTTSALSKFYGEVPAPTGPRSSSGVEDLAPADPSSPATPNYLTEPPDGLPNAQAGVGGPDKGMDEFDVAFGRREYYGDLRSLTDRIAFSQRPLFNIDASRSTQSDNLDISQLEISQDVFFSSGRDRARLGYQSYTYEPKVGNNISQNAFGGDGTYRLNDWAALTGNLWIDVLDSKGVSTAVLPTYDVFVTLWPNDVLRFDVDANRRIFDNVQSLLLQITADTFGASADYSPSDDLRVSLRASAASYSDSNHRQSAELEGVWRVRSNPTIQIGVRASGFQFSKRRNDGYFNPDAYESGEGMFRLQSSLNDQLDLEFSASGGAEDAQPGGVKPLIRASLQLSYKIDKGWTLDGGVAYFSSRDTNSSGFARTTVSVGLHRRF